MNIKVIGGVVAGVLILLFFAAYTVDERQRVILFRLGEIKEADIAPGLHFKTPFINNVRKFDGRVLTLDAKPERFLTNEKKNVTVDFFVEWRIEDVAQYYRSFRGDERNARSRLSQIMKDEMRNEFGKRTIQQAVSGERSEIMNALQVKANRITQEFGMEILDVRISRIDLPEEVNESVYDRMRAERQRTAKEFRARGKEQAERIRAGADRERTVILAEAYRDAEEVRGKGDAKAAEIYANAFSENAEFYTFYRSLNAYRETFDGQNDVLVLQPDSEFFRYFNQASGELPGGESKPGPTRVSAPPAGGESKARGASSEGSSGSDEANPKAGASSEGSSGSDESNPKAGASSEESSGTNDANPKAGASSEESSGSDESNPKAGASSEGSSGSDESNPKAGASSEGSSGSDESNPKAGASSEGSSGSDESNPKAGASGQDSSNTSESNPGSAQSRRSRGGESRQSRPSRGSESERATP